MNRAARVMASAAAIALAMVFVCIDGDAGDRGAKPCGEPDRSQCAQSFDPIAFIRTFKIGMSYVDVQAALPKNTDQDTLAYVPAEDTFLLGVDLPGSPAWSASFKFDTLDTPARRPEQLIELSCSANLSTLSESFETVVSKVSAAFGDPIELDRSEDRIQLAGWRVTGGSVLTFEYSKMRGPKDDGVNLEFVIKKNPRRARAASKEVA